MTFRPMRGCDGEPRYVEEGVMFAPRLRRAAHHNSAAMPE